MRTALLIVAILFLAGCTEVAPQKNGVAKATGSGAETARKVPAGKYKAKPQSLRKTYVDEAGRSHTDSKAFATGTETKIP